MIVDDDGTLTCLLGRRVPPVCFDGMEETVKYR
jgi:hypothetical protein